MTDENKILVTDLINEVNEELDFKDRLILFKNYNNFLIIYNISELYRCQWHLITLLLQVLLNFIFTKIIIGTLHIYLI